MTSVENGAATGLSQIAPVFSVVGVTAAEDTVVPSLRFHLRVVETSGRDVFTIALTAQINLDPARREYDAETRERLADLFGEPERWAATTHSFLWAHATTLVPSFKGQTDFTIVVPCSYDLELAAAKYLHSLPDGEAPLALHFNGTIYYPGNDGGLQMVLVPWSKSTDFRMPVSVWRETIEHYYPNTGWVAVRSQTLESLQREKLRRGLPTLDACLERLLDEVDGD